MQREFPGGVAEAKELRDKIDGLGGFEKLDKDLANLELLTGYDDKFGEGDPAFIDGLATANPAAFAKLAPAMFAKFNEISPDGWRQYIGSVVYGDFQRNELPVQLTRLADSIRRKDEAGVTESYNALSAYLATWRELAGLRVEAPKGKPAETGETDLSKREAALRSREWQAEHSGIERRIVQEEYKTAVGARKPSSEEKAEIQELFLSRRQTLAHQYFPDQAKKLDALRSRNDKAGFMRLATVMHKRVSPEAMRWAVARILKPSRAAASSTTQQRTQQQSEKPQQRQQQQPQNGAGAFKFVSAEPGTYDIDYTYPGIKNLISENKAVLRDGSKVQWRDRK